MMPQVPNTSGPLVSVPEVALLEIWIQMSGFGGGLNRSMQHHLI